MNNFRSVLVGIALTILCIGCSSQPDIVMPGTDGINRITLRSDIDLKSLSTQAIATATHYCKRAKQTLRLLGRESYNSETIRKNQIFDENQNEYHSPNESYLEFRCE